MTSINYSESGTYDHNDTFFISALAVVSSFAVVMLHYNGIFWQHPKHWGTWLSANIIETVFYFAVPIFFMITGCTLIDYKERCSTKEFFIRRLKKTVIPFAIWSLMATAHHLIKEPQTSVSLSFVIDAVLNYRYFYIYWFFIPLFAIYMSIPILANINEKIKTFTYMAILTCVTYCTIHFLKSCGINMIPEGLSLPVCSGYLIYPILGYLLHKKYISRKVRLVFYLLGFISVMAHFLTTTFMSTEKICMIFKDYTHIATVMFAISVYLFFKYNSHYIFKSEISRKIILYIQPASLGIYLTHMWFFKILINLGADSSTITFRTFVTVASFICLAVVIRFAQKIRILCYILPK